MSDSMNFVWTPGTGKSALARKFFQPESGQPITVRVVGETPSWISRYTKSPTKSKVVIVCDGVNCGVCKATGIGFWSRLINHIKRWF